MSISIYIYIYIYIHVSEEDRQGPNQLGSSRLRSAPSTDFLNKFLCGWIGSDRHQLDRVSTNRDGSVRVTCGFLGVCWFLRVHCWVCGVCVCVRVEASYVCVDDDGDWTVCWLDSDYVYFYFVCVYFSFWHVTDRPISEYPPSHGPKFHFLYDVSVIFVLF